MYLETSDRRSLFQSRPDWNCFQNKSDPQGPRRLRFSFFLFTCQTAWGRFQSPLPETRRAVEARAPENCRVRFHCSSEELQRRAIAAKRRAARRWAVYRLGLRALSTEKKNQISSAELPLINVVKSGRRCGKFTFPNHAALRPYSCVVLEFRCR
jgi:hypothetical protein